MNPIDREPLSPEERALADRLARDGAHASPSAALDAAILGAARCAVASPAPARVAVAAAPAARRRRPRRWPIGVGIAASLALAVGIAWQLRPGPGDETPRVVSEADMAAPASARMMSEPAPAPIEPAPEPRRQLAPPRPAPAPAAAESAPPPLQDAVPAEMPPAAAASDAALERMHREAEASAERATPSNRERTQDGVATGSRTALGAQAFPAEAPPPPPPAPAAIPSAPAPPPAPPSPPAPASAAPEAAARRSVAAPAPAVQMRAARNESQAMLVESIDDVPDDSDPPATADAPEVRAAWLARVRELLDAGRIDAARASLLEFRRRHPQAELPPDLQALLD